MSILERPYGLASLTESLAGLGRLPGPPFVGRGPGGLQPRRSTSSRRRSPSRPTRATCKRSSGTRRPRASASHPQRTGHNASPLESLDGRHPPQDRPARRGHDRPRRPPRPCRRRRQVGEGRAARLGARPRRPARVDAGRLDRRLRARRRARAGTAASTASSRTASPRSSSSPRTASSAGSTPTTSPSCSGRSAAAAATSASSRRSSSASSRSRRSTRVPCSSRGSGPPRCSTRGGTGSAPVPDEVTSVGRILQFPPHRRAFRSRCAAGRSRSSTRTRSAPRPRASSGSRRFGRSARRSTRSRMVPPVELSEMHMDPPDPLPYFGEHLVLRDVPAAAIDDFVAAAGPGSGSTLVVGRDPARGRRARPRRRGARCPRQAAGRVRLLRPRDGAPTSLEDAATRRDLHRVTGALRPHRSGSYLNFEEEAADAASFYGEETYRRLRAVKADVDPDELFLANHPIPPGGSGVTTGIHGGGETVSPPPHRGRRRSPGRS